MPLREQLFAEPNMKTLYCERGKHSWQRESKRGRSPRNCPDHQIEDPAPILRKVAAVIVPDPPQNETRTLHCEAGDHDWEAPVRRGKTPRDCPDHKVAPVKISETETRRIHCERGDHDWDAPRKRGKPPKNCPDHLPDEDEAAPSRAKTSSITLARVVEEVLAQPHSKSCQCGLSPDMSYDDLYALGGGCTSTDLMAAKARQEGRSLTMAEAMSAPGYVCPVLDTVRRRTGR